MYIYFEFDFKKHIMFNVIVIGGEDSGNYEFFKSKMIYYLQNKAKSGERITIYTTGDEFVDTFAKRYGIDTKFFITDWKNYGKSALKERNEEMIKDANAVIFFKNGKKDFQTLYDTAIRSGILGRTVDVPEEPTETT